MVERDEGKEKIAPKFSAMAQIYDKVKDIYYLGEINLPINSLLKDFNIKELNGETKLPIKVRIDPSGESGKPQVIINNHDGEEVLYMLAERFDKKLGGMKYFSLGAPPFGISTRDKAVKADFRIHLENPKIS